MAAPRSVGTAAVIFSVVVSGELSVSHKDRQLLLRHTRVRAFATTCAFSVLHTTGSSRYVATADCDVCEEELKACADIESVHILLSLALLPMWILVRFQEWSPPQMQNSPISWRRPSACWALVRVQ